MPSNIITSLTYFAIVYVILSIATASAAQHNTQFSSIPTFAERMRDECESRDRDKDCWEFADDIYTILQGIPEDMSVSQLSAIIKYYFAAVKKYDARGYFVLKVKRKEMKGKEVFEFLQGFYPFRAMVAQRMPVRWAGYETDEYIFLAAAVLKVDDEI